MIDKYPRTAKEAKAKGLRFYMTGKPCLNGHLSLRYASIHQCVECCRAANRESQAANRPARRAASRKWREKNVEYDQQRCRDYHKKNPEKRCAQSAAWRNANPEKQRVQEGRRRALKLGAAGEYSRDDLLAIRAAQGDKCAICRVRLRRKGHLDHIVPLSRGGTNWPRNIQWLCAPCNLRKSARDPIDHMRSLGRLL